jgi:hypothetical protein
VINQRRVSARADDAILRRHQLQKAPAQQPGRHVAQHLLIARLALNTRHTKKKKRNKKEKEKEKEKRKK